MRYALAFRLAIRLNLQANHIDQLLGAKVQQRPTVDEKRRGLAHTDGLNIQRILSLHSKLCTDNKVKSRTGLPVSRQSSILNWYPVAVPGLETVLRFGGCLPRGSYLVSINSRTLVAFWLNT